MGHLGGDFGDRHARGFRDERHRAAGARVHFQHVQGLPAIFFLDGVLNVHQPHHAHAAGERIGGLADFIQDRPLQAIRRNDAGRVARVNAGFLDVFHDAGHDHVLTVTHGIDVDLDGVF
jgi:hypothetical protein